MTAIEEALNKLRAERYRLQAETDRVGAEFRRVTKAIAALESDAATSPATAGRRGRPPGSKHSAKTRAKMAAAQKARWAKNKGGQPA